MLLILLLLCVLGFFFRRDLGRSIGESGDNARREEHWTQARLFYFCGALLGDPQAKWGLGYLRSFDASSRSPTVASTPTVRSTPLLNSLAVDELESAFKINPKAAEARYTGKTIVISGTVDWIGNDLLYKKPAINLIGSGATAHTNCVFPESARSAVNALKVGQKVRLRADFGGYLAGYVSLKNCEVVR